MGAKQRVFLLLSFFPFLGEGVFLYFFQFGPVDMQSRYNMANTDQGSSDEVSGKMKDCWG
jgi:hypothetical protein